ncbi:flagellin, partial [Pseudoalteromonas spongiae]
VRTLSQQASNGSNTDEDRLALQEEIRQLMDEVNRVASDTTFGGTNLLDGSYEASFQVGADAVQTIGFSMKSVGGTAAGNSLTANGGFTLSGIAGAASTVTGKTLHGASSDGALIGTSQQSVLSSIDSDYDASGTFATVFTETGISVSTQANAQQVMAGMDALIAVVDKKRSELGAVQNRFQS